MDKVEMVLLIILIIIILGTIALTVLVIIDCYGTYECVDIQGNEIICTFVVREKSGAWGTTEDGREVELISYKKII